MLTTMTVLLEDSSEQQNDLLDIPRFTIVVMSLFHLLKEIFQIWDEVSHSCESHHEQQGHKIWMSLTRNLNEAGGLQFDIHALLFELFTLNPSIAPWSLVMKFVIINHILHRITAIL